MKLVLVAGAWPNLIKIAPIIYVIQQAKVQEKGKANEISYRLVHISQHHDGKMSNTFSRY